MVSRPSLWRNRVSHLSSRDHLDEFNGFKYGTVAVPGPTNVVDLATARIPEKMPEGVDQVKRVNVVPHLFAFMPVDGIGRTGHGAFHKVCQETMELCGRMSGSGEAAAPEHSGLQAEILPIFLGHQVCSRFTYPKQAAGNYRLASSHRCHI